MSLTQTTSFSTASSSEGRSATAATSCNALMKALGTGWNRHVGWGEIEVVRRRGQAPTIVLHGKAAEFARRSNIVHFHLSISHTATLAIAYVIAES